MHLCVKWLEVIVPMSPKFIQLPQELQEKLEKQIDSRYPDMKNIMRSIECSGSGGSYGARVNFYGGRNLYSGF